MSITAAFLIAALLAAGCGDDEAPAGAGRQDADVAMTAEPEEERDNVRPRRKGTRMTVRGSQFGPMLFDSRRQAIYIFENDSRNKTVCYGECARAWPPVLTNGKPVAGKGVDRTLLGTVERRGGRRQVTYAGKPLYFYAHERPGQVLCHDVDLNGGFWWVVGPDGERLP